jgi:hypothetical protein
MDVGFRRLAIFAGLMGDLAWLSYAAFALEVINYGLNLAESLIILAVVLPCFLIPFGVVHGVAWVVRGFGRSRMTSENDQ